MNKRIGIIIDSNHYLTDTGPLCAELKAQQFEVFLFANGDKKFKPADNPYLHKEHLLEVVHDEVVWYTDLKDLSKKLEKKQVVAVFTQEALPFVNQPKYFQNRKYFIYNIVHSVDNFHPKAIAAGVIDKTIAPYESYGDYLGWERKDYVPLGVPKYDVVNFLDKEKIFKKYNLPGKYILLLTPNNNLLSWFVVYRILREVKKSGYVVILKGKTPKCHKWIYRLFVDKYFLSDRSYYPFVTHELISASDGVIGFDTTAVEEILVFEKPLVNFSIKPYRDKAAREGNFKQFVPMWASKFCLDLNFFDYQGIKGQFKKLPEFMTHFLKKGVNYKKIQKDVFYVPGEASKRVVDYLKNELHINT
ncbi:MAG: hypothetical protein HOE80_02395 [Candidatus Magasanikbacteria bacterium]|jgi:hypothetical protein|nr:hypothetical protein [Candidatus Magasanikbacteria bacterium]MBT4071550.1 hypothetical protein [Candidatus Magasanikbacteria bacterium]